MAAFQDLLQASFRGVPFLVPSGHVEGGRHGIKHEYPDSSSRYVEDNGLQVPNYHIKCLIHGSLANARSFQSALDTPGPGTLVHPIYGRQFVQVVGPTKMQHDDTKIGVYEFEVQFCVTGPPMFPGILSGIAAAVTGLSTSAITALFTDFQNSFALPVSATATTIATVAGAIQSLTNAALVTFGNVQDVHAADSAINRRPEFYSNDSAFVASTLHDMMRAPFEDTTNVSQDQLWSGFLLVSQAAQTITASAAAITPTTLDLAYRQSALTLVGATAQGAALASLAEAAAGKDYSTAQQVAADSSTLITLQAQVSDLPLSNDTGQMLSTVTNAALAVLAKERTTLPEVIAIKIADMPASVLSYALYETDTDLDILAGLNTLQCPLLFDGMVDVLRYAQS